MNAEQKALQLASTQLALITTQQAQACGITEWAIKHLLHTGRWELWRPGVYGISGIPKSWDRMVLAACLAAGPDALSSHRTGAVVWGAFGLVPESIELLTPVGHRVRLSGVKAHRTRHLAPEDRAVCRGIPVTSVPRTVLDVAGILNPYLLERVVDGFLDRRLATVPELIGCVGRLGGHGRAGSGELVRILNERIGMERADSTLERRILRAIRRHGLPEPVPQFQVVVNGRLFILDYAYPEYLVGVEGDGFGAHGSHGAFHRDKERDNTLGNAGWLMRHFTARSTDDYIASTVAAALALRNCGQSTAL